MRIIHNKSMGLDSAQIINFCDLDKADLELIGEKAYELGELKYLGIPIPDGFVITTSFFKKFLNQTGISEEILEIQSISHPSIKSSMPKFFEPIKKKIMHTHIPQNLAFELHKSYKKLSGLFKEQSLNISTSPLVGKFLQFSDVKGDANFIHKLKEIWALQIENPAPIVVQKNIKSKIKGKITTNASSIHKKFVALAYKIQKHFYFPKVADYVIEKNKIYITGIKPLTGIVNKSILVDANKKTQNVLLKGVCINPGIATGHVRILCNNSNAKIKNGEIIVLAQLNKSLFGKIKKAKAIVADAILLNAQDQMLYRKNIKVPTITGAVNATKILQNANIITVNGISGKIYRGGLI